MKKKIKLVGWSILGILLIAVATLLLARFVFNKQVEAYLCNSLKNEMVEKLKDAGKYVPDTTSYHFAYQKDSVQSQKIREYFKLDTVVSSTMPTWDKAISLARFIAENIPHANQKINPKRRNAIDLWKYTRSIEPAFNCRLHSILGGYPEELRTGILLEIIIPTLIADMLLGHHAVPLAASHLMVVIVADE